MKLLKHPVAVGWLAGSFVLISLSVFLSVFLSGKAAVVVLSVLLSQAASSVFFPILVGHFYETFREKETGREVWRTFRDLSEAGILRVYKDREESEDPDNAVTALREAFYAHRTGEVRLAGVSLRVFLNPTGPFYEAVRNVVLLGKEKGGVFLNVLVVHADSPEAKNRGCIEPSPNGTPMINRDLGITTAYLRTLAQQGGDRTVEFGCYKEAPYCTMVLFPDRCFFSPNILSETTPVRLPMIVFRAGSHGYRALERYFEYLWSHRIKPETLNDLGVDS